MDDGPPVPGAVEVASEAQVDSAIERMATALQDTIASADCVLVGIMLGGLMPLARLAQRLDGDFLLDYCQVSRYRGGTRGGDIEWMRAPRENLSGRTIVLVDDIYDEGVTLDFVTEACFQHGAAQVLRAVLVRKIHDRAVGTRPPDVIGLDVDDRYVFGCGMDYRHRWRHLRSIYALEPDSE